MGRGIGSDKTRTNSGLDSKTGLSSCQTKNLSLYGHG